ncbi:MAG: efflux RND transporter periplasmic adaptor subunit [Paludibacteraceae bacterium]
MNNKNKLWIIGVFSLLVLFFIWVGFFKPKTDGTQKGGKNKQKKEKKVDAYVINPTLLIDEINVSGSLLPFEEVELKSEVSGRVVNINLPEGQFVRKGTLLVKIFDGDLQAQLHKLQTQLKIQEQIYKRQSELAKIDGITKNEYEQNGLTLNSLRADIEVTKVQIRKTEILAPFDGVIGLRNISVGTVVTPSTLVATIRSSNRLKLDFFVPEKYSSIIRTEMQVRFSMSNNNKVYNATVMASERGIDNDTRNLKVRAVVNSSSPELIAGAYVNVNLRLNENPRALMIPSQAIIPSEEKKLVIIARNGKAKFTEIKTGIRKESTVEVKEGIQAGDTVITSGVLFIKEGNKLNYSSVTDSI